MWTETDRETAEREGWGLFMVDRQFLAIQRIDDPTLLADPVFETDAEAVTHVHHCAQEGSTLHQRALVLISQER